LSAGPPDVDELPVEPSGPPPEPGTAAGGPWGHAGRRSRRNTLAEGVLVEVLAAGHEMLRGLRHRMRWANVALILGEPRQTGAEVHRRDIGQSDAFPIRWDRLGLPWGAWSRAIQRRYAASVTWARTSEVC